MLMVEKSYISQIWSRELVLKRLLLQDTPQQCYTHHDSCTNVCTDGIIVIKE